MWVRLWCFENCYNESLFNVNLTQLVLSTLSELPPVIDNRPINHSRCSLVLLGWESSIYFVPYLYKMWFSWYREGKAVFLISCRFRLLKTERWATLLDTVLLINFPETSSSVCTCYLHSKTVLSALLGTF